MSDLPQSVRSIDAEAPLVPYEELKARAREVEEAERGVFDTYPWAWIAAWLSGWALLLALAAWWVGGGSVPARVVWVWVLVWAVGGLVVSALLVRVAVSASERERAALRLRRAADEIATLEQRLQASSRSLYSATETLTDATQLLLEQVDTSRDDLRNQIGSAQQLADALRLQTEALVSAQDGYRRSVLGEADEPKAEAESNPQTKSEPEPARPKLNLRPAPADSAVFEGPRPESEQPETPATDGPAPQDGWSWSDMLRKVEPEDAAPDPEADAQAVLALLEAEKLPPRVVVDDGLAYDAATLWGTGQDAELSKMLAERLGEPAELLGRRLSEDGALEGAARRLAARYRGTPPPTIEGRVDAFKTEDGRAALMMMAALAAG